MRTFLRCTHRPKAKSVPMTTARSAVLLSEPGPNELESANCDHWVVYRNPKAPLGLPRRPERQRRFSFFAIRQSEISLENTQKLGSLYWFEVERARGSKGSAAARHPKLGFHPEGSFPGYFCCDLGPVVCMRLLSENTAKTRLLETSAHHGIGTIRMSALICRFFQKNLSLRCFWSRVGCALAANKKASQTPTNQKT